MLAGLAWAATLITAGWHIESYQKSLLSSLALLTSAAGAVVFGRLADKLGRKKVYGFEVLAEPRLLRWLVGAAWRGYCSTSPTTASAIVAGVALLGLLVTVTLLPEPKGISLEELTETRPATRT